MKRVDVKSILADPIKRRELMISCVIATQAREGITTTREQAAYAVDLASGAIQCHDDRWVTACGGTEVPFRTRTGLRLLYCWQPSTGRHAYINLDTDIALTDEEARAALGTF